jgi:hypothetical protein
MNDTKKRKRDIIPIRIPKQILMKIIIMSDISLNEDKGIFMNFFGFRINTITDYPLIALITGLEYGKDKLVNKLINTIKRERKFEDFAELVCLKGSAEFIPIFAKFDRNGLKILVNTSIKENCLGFLKDIIRYIDENYVFDRKTMPYNDYVYHDAFILSISFSPFALRMIIESARKIRFYHDLTYFYKYLIRTENYQYLIDIFPLLTFLKTCDIVFISACFVDMLEIKNIKVIRYIYENHRNLIDEVYVKTMGKYFLKNKEKYREFTDILNSL